MIQGLVRQCNKLLSSPHFFTSSCTPGSYLLLAEQREMEGGEVGGGGEKIVHDRDCPQNMNRL